MDSEKRLWLCTALTVICLLAVFVYHGSIPVGITIESRENMLNRSSDWPLEGDEWRIVKETQMEDCIVSAAVSTSHKAALAVFEPTGNGGYALLSSHSTNQDTIVSMSITRIDSMSAAEINESQYHFIWFYGAPTEYAEVIYSARGKQEILRYDTTDMDIICIRRMDGAYGMNITYYDRNGRKY